MNTFSLKVIACDRVFFDGRCEQVVLPLHDGEKAIQAHHENMVFAVEIGEIRITDETGEEIVGVTGTGFAQIINNRAMVIVDTCESPEEIDVRRAEEAKERAQEQLRQKQSIQEYYRSKASLARAMSRLKVGKKDRPRFRPCHVERRGVPRTGIAAGDADHGRARRRLPQLRQ